MEIKRTQIERESNLNHNMKGGNFKIRKLTKINKKGVFGLNAVQQFFVIILGIALLAYIIVVIMGTLSGTTILEQASANVVNESGFGNRTGYTLTAASNNTGFGSTVISALYNVSEGVNTLVANSAVTVSTVGLINNASATEYANLTISYSFRFNTDEQNDLESVLGNTSTGISGFFESISPVYAILAVLVIILVLVVLVRVVQTPAGTKATPQL